MASLLIFNPLAKHQKMWIIRILNKLVFDIFYANLQITFTIHQAFRMKENINNKMIILARETRSMNQNELAEKIKMSATNLSKIERGDIGISNEILEAIAEVTSYPMHFFQQPGEIIPENLSYRKRFNVAQRLLVPINAKVNIIKRHAEFLTRALEVPLPILPSFTVGECQGPETIAIKLRKKWNINAGPIDNLTKVLEEQGVGIMSFDFGTTRVDSKSIFTDEQYPVICFNSTLLADRQRFSLAFELGQLIMHSFNNVSIDRDITHEANAFAAEFLLPARDIKQDFKNGISIALLGELKKKWKVSMIALLYRADDLGFITLNQKRYLLQQFNQLQIRRREPRELDTAIEEPRLLKRWIADYRAKTKLGVAEMSALLCLNVDEFIELYS